MENFTAKENETLATTTFVDNAQVRRETYSTSTIDSIPKPNQSIIDYLSRPVLLSTGLWSTAQPANTVLYSWDTFNAWGVVPWADKLKGFALLRGTMCLKVIINANPFQLGRLILNFVPMVNSLGTEITTRTSFLASKSMLPRVYLDANDASCVLEIPYINTMMWMDRDNNQTHWGNFYLTVFSALLTGSAGQTDIEYSIYAYIKDAEIAAPIVPQGPKSKKKYKAKTFSKKSNIESEAFDANKPLSSSLMVASKVTSSLTGIPEISDYIAPVTWGLRALSGVASFFGFSKQRTLAAPIAVERFIDKYAACGDGSTSVLPLTLMHDNHLVISDDYDLVSEDQMSWSWLKQQECLIEEKSWTTSQATDVVLATYPHSNTNAYLLNYTVGAHTAALAIGPPLYYLTKAFEQWRGGIRFRFVFVKTGYHTGRLQFTYTPLKVVTTQPNTTTSAYSIREIVDLHTANEIVLELPYMLAEPWLYNSQSAGSLQVRVLNQLRCPETCSPTIKMLVYVSACEDYEISVPTWKQGAWNLPFTPESGVDTDDDVVIDEPIGGFTIPPLGIEFTSHCVGEVFNSIKQLTNRYNIIPELAKVTPTDYLSVNPWLVGKVNLTAVTGVWTASNAGGDPYSYLCRMYLGYRGSMNVKLVNGNTDTSKRDGVILASYMPNVAASQKEIDTVGSLLNSTGAIDWVTDGSSFINGFVGTTANDSGVGTISVSAPYYNRTPFRVIVPTNAFGNPITSRGYVSFQGNGNLDGKYRLFRSTGDDFQFNYYLGCPPLITAYV